MNNNKMVLLVIGIVLILGVSFAGGYFFFGRGAKPEVSLASNPPTTALASSPETAVPTQAETSQPTPTAAYLAQAVSAAEMFSEFTCPCCGNLIGDCDCGMAGERRGFVSGLVSSGSNKLEIYLAYADQYGLDSFASEEVRADIREYKVANAPAERPQIALEPQNVDLGDVSAKGGKAEASITIKNYGQTDLIVDNLSTSCGCTTVSVVNNGEEGPVFGTSTPSEGWSTTIQPGETAELRIYYDPNVHKDARGPMMREVYFSSHAPVGPGVPASRELSQVE